MLKNSIQSVRTTEEVNIKMVTDAFESLRTIINKHESVLIQQIRAIKTRNENLIGGYQNQLMGKQKTLDEQRTDFKGILSTNDHTNLLQANKRLTDSLKKIAEELNELISPIKIEYRIEGVNQLQPAVDASLKQARVVEIGNLFIVANY